jgi:hypothetical protein
LSLLQRPRLDLTSVTGRALVGSVALAVGASVVVASCTNEDDRSQAQPASEATATTARTTTIPRTSGNGGTTERTTSIPEQPPQGVILREVDGSYPAGLSNDPAFFPLGVWLETVADEADVAIDRSFGLNLYVALAHDEAVALDAIEDSGMRLLLQADEWSGDPRVDHPAVDGWFVYDEADMMYGPGSDDWSGRDGWNTCIPIQDEGGQCGYTVMQHYASRIPAGALRHANYGMGVAFNETDAQAAKFVNGSFQDVLSADVYFFTHPDIPSSDRRGERYGWLIDRLRRLDARDGTRRPIWAVVEVGHPFTEESAPTITAPQMRSAVWHSIIAGARGIVYFNHSFGGSCPNFSVLREGCDPEMGPAVTEVNSQITQLAPVLNAPFADGYVHANGPAKVMAKRGPDGAWYVFAAAATTGKKGGDVTFRVTAGSEVEVMFENRTLSPNDGQFTDAFDDGNAVHIYRVT